MELLQVILLTTLTALVSSQCTGTSSPSDHSSYVLSWEVSVDRTTVDFNVSVTTPANTWVAVGFSASSIMNDSDIVIAADNGVMSFVEDRWTSMRATPIFDIVQSLTNTVTDRDGDDISFSFTRHIISNDTNNDIDLNTCLHVLWAYGGNVNEFQSPASFTKHIQKGAFSVQMCLQQCNGAAAITLSVVILTLATVIAMVSV